MGSATITATWTESGATVSETVSLTVNSPTLEIYQEGTTTAPPTTLLIDTSIDLTADLIDPTDPPASFGPFDPLTDVEWTTGDDDILTVDANGLVTAIAPGGTSITATWIPSQGDGNPVEAQVSFTVNVPAPTLTSVTPGTADFGELITITGSGFHPAMEIVIDGDAVGGDSDSDRLYEPTIVNSTTATFFMPFGDSGPIEVQVGAPGQRSDVVEIEREIVASTATEPENDSRSTAPLVTFPLDMWGTVDGIDVNDRFLFTLAAETTVDVSLDWAGPSGDLDLLWVDSPPTAFQACTFDTATGAHPETATCTFPAGSYTLEVNSYDHEIGYYRVQVSVVP